MNIGAIFGALGDFLSFEASGPGFSTLEVKFAPFSELQSLCLPKLVQFVLRLHYLLESPESMHAT